MIDKDNNNNSLSSNTRHNREKIIRSTNTPLGFFVLLVLITEFFFGVGFFTASSVYKPYFLAIFTIILLGVLGLVAFLAVRFPESLRGEGQNDSYRSEDLQGGNTEDYKTHLEYVNQRVSFLKDLEKSIDQNKFRKQNSFYLTLSICSGLFGLYFFIRHFVVDPIAYNNNDGASYVIIYSVFHYLYYSLALLVAIALTIVRRKQSFIYEQIGYLLIIAFSAVWMACSYHEIGSFSLNYFSLLSVFILLSTLFVFLVKYNYRDIIYNPTIRKRGVVFLVLLGILPICLLFFQSNSKTGSFKNISLSHVVLKEIVGKSSSEVKKYSPDFLMNSDTGKIADGRIEIRERSVPFLTSNYKNYQLFRLDLDIVNGRDYKLAGEFLVYPRSQYVLNKDTARFNSFCDVASNEFEYLPPSLDLYTTYCKEIKRGNNNLYILDNFSLKDADILYQVEFYPRDTTIAKEDFELYISLRDFESIKFID